LKSLDERDIWMKRLQKAGNVRHLENEFELGDTVLGQGSYGRVLKGKRKSNGEPVAIK